MIPLRTAADGTPEVVLSRVGEQYRVDALGWVAALFTPDGTKLSVEVNPDVHPLDAEEVYERAIAPRLGQLRGRPNLHASAVSFGGRAVAFHGRSGAGKSTLATLLVERGATLLSDDALELEPRDDTYWAIPTARETQLREGTASEVRERLGPGVRGLAKFVYSLPVATEPAPLACIYVLGDSTPEPQLTPMSKLDAVAEIASNLHRMDPTDARLLALELDFLEKLVSSVRVVRLLHPRSFEARVELCDFILDDLQQTS